MVESAPNPQQSKCADEQRLKYLEFVLIAFLNAVMFIAKLYSFVKDNLGPLKPGVNSVENTVRSIAGPVYRKYHYVPFEILKFLDRKIDESVNKVYLPGSLKRVSTKVYKKAKKAPIAARSVMSDVKNAGMVGTAKTVYSKYEPVAKDFYTKYEPVTEQYVGHAWNFLNQYRLFHRAVQKVGPVANYCSEMYNEKVQDAAGKGYKVASHLPLVPTEKIAKVLANGNIEPTVLEVSHSGEAVAAN